jgi:hypothetical protein
VIHLGGDHHLVTAGKSRSAANDLFAAAVGVAVCGIEEVNAAFRACWIIGRLLSSGSVQACLPRSGSPKVMQPRQSRETRGGSITEGDIVQSALLLFIKGIP